MWILYFFSPGREGDNDGPQIAYVGTQIADSRNRHGLLAVLLVVILTQLALNIFHPIFTD
jgi:hypothetical protein